MATVRIRDLARNTGGVVAEVERAGRPALITRHGKPVAVLSAVDEGAIEDYPLADAAEYVQGRRLADEELARGETRSLASLLPELSTSE